MNRFSHRQNLTWVRRLLFPALLFAALAGVFVRGIGEISSVSADEQRKSLETSILRSVVQCYAIEGRYPESLSYLEENYGVSWDPEQFVVHYEISGANLMPTVAVIPLSDEGGTAK